MRPRARVMSRSSQEDLPGEHRHEPGDGLDQGRLAGAVRPEHRDDLAALDDERRAAHDRQARLVAGLQRLDSRTCAHAGGPEIGLDDPRIVAHHLARRPGHQERALRHHQHAARTGRMTRSMLCSMIRKVTPSRLSVSDPVDDGVEQHRVDAGRPARRAGSARVRPSGCARAPGACAARRRARAPARWARRDEPDEIEPVHGASRRERALLRGDPSPGVSQLAQNALAALAGAAPA